MTSKTYVYKLINPESDKFYIGITKNPKRRVTVHRLMARSGKKTPLYCWIRSHNYIFEMVIISEFDNRSDACEMEIKLISFYRESSAPLLNIASGGEGGWVVRDIDNWKAKLSSSREGAKPALGMKHSEENKLLFSRLSNKYWEDKSTHTRNAEAILALDHKRAKEVYGISTTHYYRLRKLYKPSE